MGLVGLDAIMAGLNGLPGGVGLPAFLADRAATLLQVVPVGEERGGEPCMEVSAPEDAQVWSIYALDGEGEASLIHDAADPVEAAQLVERIVNWCGLPVGYLDTSRRTPFGTLSDLVDRLAEEIHDDIPGYDDPEDFRADDFDNHPLAALREALSDACNYNGDA